MSQDVGSEKRLKSVNSSDFSKKKRKHADEDHHKLKKKKRKHVHDEQHEMEDEVQVPTTPTPKQPHRKEKSKKSKGGSPLSLKTREPTNETVRTDVVADSPLRPTKGDAVEGTSSSSFCSKRLSYLVPLPPIAISTTSALSSLLAIHISPLLLSYQPSLGGIVIAFSDPRLSSVEPTHAEAEGIPGESLLNNEEAYPTIDRPLQLAHSRDEHGVSFIWLTVTFLLLDLKPGAELEGYINIANEGFVGIVSYNYFQVSIGKDRIPRTWKWNGLKGDAEKPTKRKMGKKTKLRDEDSSQQKPSGDEIAIDPTTEVADDAALENGTLPESSMKDTGYFSISPSTERITGPVKYRVVDTDIIPGHSADKWGLQITGTLLDEEEEARVREADGKRWEAQQQTRRDKRLGYTQQASAADHAEVPGTPSRAAQVGGEDVVMTGALAIASSPAPTTPKKRHRKNH